MPFSDFKNQWKDNRYNNYFSEKTVVSEGCEVMDSKMGYFSRIKSHSHLRSSTLGDYSIVSNYSVISASEIGKFNSIGYGNYIGLWEHNMWVTTHSFYLYEGSGGFVQGYQTYEKDSTVTKIGNDVWTGANAVILKGIEIGDGAVVGAGSVVTKNVPPYGIVVGNPADVIRFRFDQDAVSYLLKLKWWDLPRETIQEMVDLKLWDNIDKIREYFNKKESENNGKI
jgi:chloramphenicol O-acetyltransferase type B